MDRPFMPNDPFAAPENDTDRPVSWYQTTVLELFFATTLVAVSIGIFLHLSEALAVLMGAGLITYGTSRIWPPANPIIGAVRGFLAATTIGWALFLLGLGDLAGRIGMVALLPPLGYITGFVQSELSHCE